MTRERDALLERVRAQLPVVPDPFERLVQRRAVKAQRKRVAAGALGLGITVALIVGLLVWTSRTDSVRRVPADQNTDIPLMAEPGQYYYVRGVSWYPGDAFGARPIVGEEWIGSDGSGRRNYLGDLPSEYSSSEGPYGPGEYPERFLPSLSTDPSVLMEQLVERGSSSGASPNPIATTSPGRSQETTSLLRTIQDLLEGGEWFLTPEQVRALFLATQSIDDVTTETNVTDLMGRAATRLSFVEQDGEGGGSRVEWYFEPSTGQFMGEVWVDERTGDVEAAGLVVMAGIADSIDDRPEPDARYVPEGPSLPAFLEPGA